MSTEDVLVIQRRGPDRVTFRTDFPLLISIAPNHIRQGLLGPPPLSGQQQAADRMGVSRQTFGRIVTEARSKVARVLVQGLALKIEGGKISVAAQRRFQCLECEHEWSLSAGTGRPADCPECQSPRLQRADRSCCDVCPDTAEAAGSGVDSSRTSPAPEIEPESQPLDPRSHSPENV